MDPSIQVKFIPNIFVFNLMEILIIKQIPLFFEAPCTLRYQFANLHLFLEGSRHSRKLKIFGSQMWLPKLTTFNHNILLFCFVFIQFFVFIGCFWNFKSHINTVLSKVGLLSETLSRYTSYHTYYTRVQTWVWGKSLTYSCDTYY